jgi:anti-sigma-K factor RskA
MRKQLHEIREIDQYLLQTMPAADKLVFQARMLTDTNLRENVRHQQEAHHLIRQTGREAQREKLAAIHSRLWETDEAFRAEISSIFK